MKHLSIVAVPSFPRLRCFPQGCGFKQWTGDDSKALMKVCTVFRFYWSLNQLSGLSTCYCQPCPSADGAGIKCLHGFLLSSPMKYTWWINPGCHWHSHRLVPCKSCCIWRCWHTQPFLTTTSAFSEAFPASHSDVRCSEWALLVNHRIEVYQSSQRTIPTIQPLWSIRSNVTH